MLLRATLLIFVLLGYTQMVEAQIGKDSVLTQSEGWQSEILTFPLGFAPTIDLDGFEELRFAPNWSDSTNTNFWTYVFVWYVDRKQPITAERLKSYFDAYYDGLMNITMIDRNGVVNPMNLDTTNSLFFKKDDGFLGKVRTYDRFFSKDYITLNIRVHESYCAKTNTEVIRCELSPQSFDHDVWKIFEPIQLKPICDWE